ncbi:MAG: amidohydrolase family protein [Chloroflexi bacterium]|nr:amidohydrolase family protein [Chloroflexota bacterium]
MASTTVFWNATLIDGTGRDPQPGMAVVVEGERITRVAANDSFEPPRDAERIDCSGLCLMPGLTDAHTHLGIVGTDMAGAKVEPAGILALRIAKVIEETLDAGFTTVRDGGGIDGGWAHAVSSGLLRGPRILASGAMISQTGGHGDWRPRFSDDPPRQTVPGLFAFPELCDSPAAVRRAAREQLRRGATQLKVMASGGAMSPTDELEHSQFTVEELRAAVEAAEAAGTYVLAHAYAPPAIRNALEAGVTSIEHGNFLDEETAAAIKSKNAWLVPTLATYELIDRFGEAGGVPETNLRKIRQAKARGEEALRIAQDAGLQIGSGSDLLGPMQPMKTTELTLKSAVIGVMPAIVSATQSNARLFRMEERIGTVEEGKWADLIAVQGNPIDDITVLEPAENVRLVMKQGSVVKRLME